MPFSGQAASSFAEGLKGGYGAVDTAMTNKQTREHRAQNASQKAEQHKQQMANRQIGMEGQQQQNDLQQVKLDAIASVKLDDAAKQVPKLLSNWTTGEVEDQDIRNWLEVNPEMSQKLGVQNVATIGSINPADATKRDTALGKWMEENQMLDSSDYMLGDELDEVAYHADLVKIATALEPTLKMADGVVLDINSLAIVTGSAKNTMSKQQRQTQEVLAGVYKKVDAVGHDKKSANQELYDMAVSTVEVGEFDSEADIAKAINDEFIRLKRTPKAEAKPTANAELYEMATRTVNIDDFADEEAYYTAVNEEFIRLKRDKKSSTTNKPSDIRKLEYLQAIVNTKDGDLLPDGTESTKTKRDTAQGMIGKMQYTGTQINVGDKIDRTTKGITQAPAEDKGFSVDRPNDPLTPTQIEAEASFDETTKGKDTNFKKRRDEYSQNAPMQREIADIATEMDDAIKKGKFKSGWFDTGLEWLAQRDPTGTLHASLQQVRTEADLQTIGADVLKAYSGASATEQEFARTMMRIFGDPNMQEEVRLELFQNFVNREVGKFEAETDFMLRRKQYSTVQEAIQQANDEVDVNKPPIESEQTKRDAIFGGL